MEKLKKKYYLPDILINILSRGRGLYFEVILDMYFKFLYQKYMLNHNSGNIAPLAPYLFACNTSQNVLSSQIRQSSINGSGKYALDTVFVLRIEV